MKFVSEDQALEAISELLPPNLAVMDGASWVGY